MQHGTKKQKQDAMHVWMENVTINQFEVCLRESRALDGGHNKIVVVSDEFMKIISLPMFTERKGALQTSKIPSLRHLPLPLFTEWKRAR